MMDATKAIRVSRPIATPSQSSVEPAERMERGSSPEIAALAYQYWQERGSPNSYAGRRLAAGRARSRMPQLNIPPTIETGSWDIPVVSVSTTPGDHVELERLLPMPRWKVYRSSTVRSAVRLMRALRLVPIVVCAADVFPATWQGLLAQIGLLPKPPYLIVTSPIADDRLWAEALNLGAYDVLGKPFDVAELTRSLGLAWLRTQRELGSAEARVTTLEVCIDGRYRGLVVRSLR